MHDEKAQKGNLAVKVISWVFSFTEEETEHTELRCLWCCFLAQQCLYQVESTITMTETLRGVNNLINQGCSHLLNEFILAHSQARLSCHIISIIAYNLHHTVSARLKTQTHFCVSENHVNEPHENHGLIHDILQQAAEGALYLCEIWNGIG